LLLLWRCLAAAGICGCRWGLGRSEVCQELCCGC
jgi:hypothetical protein